MENAFLPYEEAFLEWKDSGYPNVKSETSEFINSLTSSNRRFNLWEHQLDGFLRIVYAYEILEKKKVLSNIITGGGKTVLIAATIAWLKKAHKINIFLILTPNLIVKARLERDFINGKIFRECELISEDEQDVLNQLNCHMLVSGSEPQGMLGAGIILGNIQQLYSSHSGGKRNLNYLEKFLGNIAVFNDEAHNTVAVEFTRVLETISSKCEFRLDTTATPDRADGTQPDSEMIQYYDVVDGLKDGIIKSVVVYEPQVRLIILTYTNITTGERKKITELDKEFEDAERNVRPFQWILDPEPMLKQMRIAIRRHEEQKIRAKGRYKPILFVVTMNIEEGERTQRMLQNECGIKTLLLTEKSDEVNRDEAMNIGSADSPYEAIVSVMMLREGWDVPEVSTILLLRKFSSPVYGKQIIGRGLRKIIRNRDEAEILAVVDHPRLGHSWLWDAVGVSNIRQDVTDDQIFDAEGELPPIRNIQRIVNFEKIITIPDPINIDSDIDFPRIDDAISDDEVEKNWQAIIDGAIYDDRILTITKTSYDDIEVKSSGNKWVEHQTGITDDEISDIEIEKYNKFDELKRQELEQKLKDEILRISTELLNENGFNDMLLEIVYSKIFEHVKEKIFSGGHLAEIDGEIIKLAIYCIPTIKNTFTPQVIRGMLGEKNV